LIVLVLKEKRKKKKKEKKPTSVPEVSRGKPGSNEKSNSLIFCSAVV